MSVYGYMTKKKMLPPIVEVVKNIVAEVPVSVKAEFARQAVLSGKSEKELAGEYIIKGMEQEKY